MDKEVRNYIDGLSTLSAKCAAVAEFADACLRRLRWKLIRREVRPVYVTAGQVRAAADAKVDLAPCRLLECPQAAGRARFDDETRAFLKRYESQFTEFLSRGDTLRSDPEETWTLHQFGWLLGRALDREDPAAPAFVEAAVLGWMERCPRPCPQPAWRSFSISERLVSWTYLMELGLLPKDSVRIRDSMLVQARHLAGRLENFSDGATNNHLLNNGRALLVTGKVLGASGLQSLGRAIMLEEARRQFTSDGFLDEGSSHYQMVFTRAYLDALRFDPQLVEPLGELVSRMKANCRFLRDWDAAERLVMPFFGDISPDPPPGLFHPGSRFWDSAPLWDRPWYEPGSEVPVSHAEGWATIERAGIGRWRGGGLTLWWHARRGGLRRLHAHNDWGAFQLHASGRPVLVDLGRPTYVQSDREFDFRTTLAHNTLRLDGFEQALFSKRDAYRACYHTEGVQSRIQDDTLTLEIDCFRRLNPPTEWSRSFDLRGGRLAVRDRLLCGKPRALEVAFHIGPGLSAATDGDAIVLDGAFRLRPAPGGSIRIVNGGGTDEPGGYCSTLYGERRATCSIFVSYPPRSDFDLLHGFDRL